MRWVKEGDPEEKKSSPFPPQSKSQLHTLLDKMALPDSLILCFTRLTTCTLPSLGEVVLMKGDPSDGLVRHYATLSNNYWGRGFVCLCVVSIFLCCYPPMLLVSFLPEDYLREHDGFR